VKPRAILIGVLLTGLLLPGTQCSSAPEEAFLPQQAGFEKARKLMVEDQIRARGVRNTRVLEAMGVVPRHEFVPEAFRAQAYDDQPLPTSQGQTISQPYIVALMTELADPKPEHRVLEVGTGSGYQAAVLSGLVRDVYTIELLPELARTAAERLKRLGYNNVHARDGDGYLGWPEHAPFDSILVTAGAPEIPQPLVEQLKPGGRMIIPVGDISSVQTLQIVEKDANGNVRVRDSIPVRFVPLLRSPRQ
jgi:protein-L-isoaspartate(D-aspartate) O-methyltransferase